MTGDFELEPCGPSGPPAPRRPKLGRPGRRKLAAVAVAVGLVLAGLGLARRDGSSAVDDQIDAVRAFLRRPAPLTFDVDYRASEDGGDGPHVVGSTRLAGRLDGSGRAAWTETSGVGWEPHPFVEENVLVAHGLYTRQGDDATQVVGRRWVYSDRKDFDDSVRRKRERPFAFFDSASDSPLVGALLTGDFEAVLGRLEHPVAAGAGTIRASRQVTDLFPGAVQNQTELRVELTAAAGRPLRLVLRHDLGQVGDDHDDKQTVTDIRFDWGRPAKIAEVAVADVESTPEIDEEAFATSSFAPILAPTDLPSRMLLIAARVDDVFTCNGSSFEYEVPGGATLFYKQWFCPPDLTGEQWSDDDGVERPFVAGAYSGTIRRARPKSGAAARAIVRLSLDGSFIHAETDLDDADLRAIFASLAPVDFATQPVARQLPPS